MGMNRSNIPVAFSNLYIEAYWDSEAETDIQMEYKQIFDVYKSKRAFEEDAGVSGFSAAPQKREGAPFEYDAAVQTYLTRYQMYTYGQGFQVTQEAQEDSEAFNLVDRFIPDLKNSLYTTVNTVASNVLNDGFTVTTVTGDGVALFSASHPTVGAGLQSNVLATPADLSYTSLQDLITQIMQTRDDRGKPAPLHANKLILPTGLWGVGTGILQTAGAPGNANNDTNVIRAYGGLLEQGMCINHYLTDTDAWFVKTSAKHGLKFFDRIPVKLEDIPETVSVAGDIAVRGRVRFAAGASNWRGSFASQGV